MLNTTLTVFSGTTDNQLLMPRIPSHGLYVLTDCENHSWNELLEKTETILNTGIALLQYRNKKDNADVRLEQAEKLQHICRHYNVPLIINDDMDLVKKINAEGIHLGNEDLPCAAARKQFGAEYIIGISCYNSLASAIKSEHDGADYVAFGSFYPSKTKPGAVSADPELLQSAREHITLPVVAIGGITPENALPLLKAGADILAVSRALYNSENPGYQVCKFNQLFE